MRSMARESQNDQFEPGTPVGVKGILRGNPLNKRISPRVRSPFFCLPLFRVHLLLLRDMADDGK